MKNTSKATEVLSFNRNDWSGRTETMVVDRSGMTFKVMDYSFKLVELVGPEYDDIRDLCGTGYRILSADGSWREDHSLGTVWVEGQDATAASLGLSREDADPFVAAAQLLCNII